MKIRNGFVSNSSSSSFVILKNKLTEEQINQIKNHISFVLENKDMFKHYMLNYIDKYDQWEIKEENNLICGKTLMDNFDMKFFLNQIGISPEDIEWDLNC